MRFEIMSNLHGIQHKSNNDNILNDLHYMCMSAKVIISALKNGCDVAQLPNGDIIVAEAKIINVNTQYRWDRSQNRLV